MRNARKILKETFIFVVPIFILLHLLTAGYWTVEYFNKEGQKITSKIQGFPFPSRGNFWGVEFYNSGDVSFSLTNASINFTIYFALSALLYYFFLRSLDTPKILIAAFIFAIYLIGAFSLLSYFVFVGTNYPWYDNYKIISYHLWGF